MNGTRDLVRSALFLAACLASITAAASATESYQLKAAPNNAITVERAGKRAVYQPVFTIIKATTDPQLGLSGFASTPGESLEGVNVENYPVPRWRTANGNGKTDVIYEAGAVTEVRASGSRALDNGGTAWTFAANPDFTLEAEVRPVAGEAPRISWKFTAHTPGWYTVGYTGAPASNPAGDDGFLQPLIWQEKRFPRAPLMTAESMGGLPLTLVTRDGVTRGLSVDPGESPYRLPTIANARSVISKARHSPPPSRRCSDRLTRASKRARAQRSRCGRCWSVATGIKRLPKPRVACSASTTTDRISSNRSTPPSIR
jgi:hypothetical protein